MQPTEKEALLAAVQRACSYDYINRIIDLICTDAWAPICIFLHVSGQNGSVHVKSIDTLYVQVSI